MKIAVLVMAIMVMCVCPGSISEEKSIVPLARGPKQCRFPKGKPGSVRTDGCIKSTCINGKWKPEVRTDICCYKQQVQQTEELAIKIQTLERELTNKMDDLTQMVKHNNELMQKLIEEKIATCATNTPATTTTTAAPTTTTPMVEGVLYTRGTSTQLFLPHTGKTCSLQSLPDSRYCHSMDVVSNTIILCGGSGSSSCLQFLTTSSTGSWVNYATSAQRRTYHSSHVFKDQLLLIGGSVSPGTSEIIGNGTGYNLQQNTIFACSIPDHSSTILTGGRSSGSVYYKTVAKYNLQGFVENLPEMAEARALHGCGLYTNEWNTEVMVVSGGYNGAVLSSTELLTPGATSWTTGESLPRTLYGPASVNMGEYFFIIGGNGNGDRGEILKFNGNWTEVGKVYAGHHVRATRIMIATTGPGGKLDITACY